MNCRKDRQYNEKKKTTLSNERRQASCVDYRNGQLLSNKSDGLLDMGGVMKRFEVEISAVYIIEAEDYEEAKEEVLMNYTIDKHDFEINEIEDEEVSDE